MALARQNLRVFFDLEKDDRFKISKFANGGFLTMEKADKKYG